MLEEKTEYNSLVIRPPTVNDAADIHALVSAAAELDLNSQYCYLLLCTHFHDTCVVAARGGAIIGFAGAYLPPPKPDTLFIWQIVTRDSARKMGVARAMMDSLLKRPGVPGTVFIETTITPSNTASDAFFTKLAGDYRAGCEKTVYFTESLFQGGGHEAEIRYRIGPIKTVGDEK